MNDTIILLDPLGLIILALILIVLLPVALWLGITLLWVGAGFLAGTFIYFFILYLTGIPMLAIAAGIATAIMIWGALLRG